MERTISVTYHNKEHMKARTGEKRGILSQKGTRNAGQKIQGVEQQKERGSGREERWMQDVGESGRGSA